MLDDQFDFHSFSLRKVTLRTYVDMLAWGHSGLMASPAYGKALAGSIAVLRALHDEQVAVVDTSSAGPASEALLSAADKKKAKRALAKSRNATFQATVAAKAAELSANVVTEATQADEKKKKPLPPLTGHNVHDDPVGAKLLTAARESPLVEAHRLATLWQSKAPCDPHAHAAAFDVALAQRKYLVCDRALMLAH